MKRETTSKMLSYDFPPELVAIKPQRPSRVLYSPSSYSYQEIDIPTVLQKFQKGDVFILNNSKVEKRRVMGFTTKGQSVEILFVHPQPPLKWQVLCLSSKIKKQTVHLPANIKLQLLEEGRPQSAKVSKPLTLEYFEKYGQMPLPPYIQKQRKSTNQAFKDTSWYQNPYGKIHGSSASPTASLHFNKQDIIALQKKGVKIVEITLHVGFPTYLPLDSQASLHSEWCFVPKTALQTMESALKSHNRLAALGTTSVRAIESMAHGILTETHKGFEGKTHLMITPTDTFQYVNCLLTNFHQPCSSLLALVIAFAGKKRVIEGYQWAIDHKFRLFSYGDLSVWER